MSLHGKAHVGVLLKEGCIGLNRGLLVRTNIGLVVIEVDVFDVLRKHLLVGHGGLSWRRRWRGRIYCDPRCCRLAATRSFSGECVSRRFGRAHLLRAAGLYGANTLI